MATSRPPYSPEFRRQMVDLVHAGRDPDELAQEFEPTSQSSRARVAKTSPKEGRHEAGLRASVGLSATSWCGCAEMAVGQRQPKDIIHHGDLCANAVWRMGSQYTSVAFGKR